MGRVKVISSGEETASEVSTILHHSRLLNVEEEEPEHVFFTTGSKTIFKKIASTWLEKPILNVAKVKLESEREAESKF